MPRRTTKERFWSKVDRGGADECWEWRAAKKGPLGHGTFYIGKRPDGSHHFEPSHRVAFFLTHGRWPSPCCLHKCPGGGNGACCNPAHLKEGTHKENAADRAADGREAWGQRNGHAKLEERQALSICERVARGVPQRLIAEEFGVDQSTVSRIASGKRWACLGR